MFKIGEFSRLAQVSIRMLRYYDETELLKPAFIQEDTGYRFYSLEQIKVLRKIVFLRDAGFSVGEIKALMDKWNAKNIQEALAHKSVEIKEIISKEKERLGKIEDAMKELENNCRTLYDQVTIKSIPSYKVFSLRKKVHSYFCEGQLWAELCQEVARRKLAIGEETFCFTIYHPHKEELQNVDSYSMNSHSENNQREAFLGEDQQQIDMEVCVQCDVPTYSEGLFSCRCVPALQRVASVMVYGPFENINGVYLEVAKWLEENSQYEMLGESRQISHKGPNNESNAEKYITEIQIAIGLKREP